MTLPFQNQPIIKSKQVHKHKREKTGVCSCDGDPWGETSSHNECGAGFYLGDGSEELRPLEWGNTP